MEQELNKYQTGQVMLIDKPENWTSFDVVNKIRYQIKRKFNLKKIKVGHAGTLDPLATGLVIICTGRMTKQIENFQAQVKEYEAEVYLGATTPSFDLETEIDAQYPINHITEPLIYETAKSFIGKQEQTPPVFSAKKINGKRAYLSAREGKKVEMRKHNIEIFELEITDINLPVVKMRILCSKGTYIRSLAYDFGQKLNSGAYLQKLRRTKIGDYSIKDAQTIDNSIKML